MSRYYYQVIYYYELGCGFDALRYFFDLYANML